MASKAMNVEISDWKLITDINNRIENKSIFRANNGKLWPKQCPFCGGTVREYGAEINLDQDVISSLDFLKWRQFTRPFIDKAGLHLPDILSMTNGRHYFVRCDNYYNQITPCHATNFTWFKDLDTARKDFFSRADELKEIYS